MIREARISDAKEVCEILVASITQLCVEDHQNDSTLLSAWLANKTVESCESWIASDKTVTLVKETEKDICGVADLGINGHLYLFYVSPEHVGSGHGSALIKAVQTLANSIGLTELSLDSTKTALGCYRKQGFHTQGENHNANGLVVYPMIKKLR